MFIFRIPRVLINKIGKLFLQETVFHSGNLLSDIFSWNLSWFNISRKKTSIISEWTKKRVITPWSKGLTPSWNVTRVFLNFYCILNDSGKRVQQDTNYNYVYPRSFMESYSRFLEVQLVNFSSIFHYFANLSKLEKSISTREKRKRGGNVSGEV